MKYVNYSLGATAQHTLTAFAALRTGRASGHYSARKVAGRLK